MNAHATRAVAILLLGCLGGCTSVPGSTPHERPLPATELGLQGAAYTAPPANWWTVLGDPQLDRLEQEALARNPSLSVALARVKSAQEFAHMAGAANKPQVSANAAAARELVSANWIYPPPFGGATFWDASLGLNLSWNLDFWGRQSALIDQSQRLAAAAGLDAAGSSQLISSAVAQAYVELTRAHDLEAIADRAAEQRRRLRELTAQRVHAGLDTTVELRGAESNVAAIDLEREQTRLAQQAAIHALAALIGRGADAYGSVEAPQLDLERALALPEALPADLLAHRPDIAAARLRVEAARAGHAAAKASFYPNVNLAAFAGFEAIGFDKLFDSSSKEWMVEPAIHLPLFDAGLLRAEYRKAAAEVDAATGSYNETVLRAVRESADQISRIASLDRQLADSQRSLAAAESAYALAEQRYGAGLSSYLSVLNAETQVLAARRQRVNLLADRTLARVALLVALGGSFKETN
ncbi:MAG TPA: efflux transporter outer membrane subunit [Steroidobacteraceae bacterium]|nr:efflux transporter outer membrane subunit [Steroidobacteraceae bacterium]